MNTSIVTLQIIERQRIVMDDVQPPGSKIDVKEKDLAAVFCIHIYCIFKKASVLEGRGGCSGEPE